MLRLESLRTIAQMMAEQENDSEKEDKGPSEKSKSKSSLKKDGNNTKGFPTNLNRTITGKKPDTIIIYKKD